MKGVSSSSSVLEFKSGGVGGSKAQAASQECKRLPPIETVAPENMAAHKKKIRECAGPGPTPHLPKGGITTFYEPGGQSSYGAPQPASPEAAQGAASPSEASRQKPSSEAETQAGQEEAPQAAEEAETQPGQEASGQEGVSEAAPETEETTGSIEGKKTICRKVHGTGQYICTEAPKSSPQKRAAPVRRSRPRQ